MNQLPFNAYDIFAYLASGSIIVSTVDYLYGSQWLLQNEHSAAFTLVLVFSFYLTGHIVATCSAAVFESLIVARFLGQPFTRLMNDKKSKAAWMFPLYFRTLPVVTRERIRQKLRKNSFSGEGEALFLHIFSIVKSNDNTKKRLDEFRNLYGFSRNVSFSFFIVFLMIIIGQPDEHRVVPLGWALVSLFASIAMFYRYLKFLRQYTYEAFVTYSEQLETK